MRKYKLVVMCNGLYCLFVEWLVVAARAVDSTAYGLTWTYRTIDRDWNVRKHVCKWEDLQSIEVEVLFLDNDGLIRSRSSNTRFDCHSVTRSTNIAYDNCNYTRFSSYSSPSKATRAYDARDLSSFTRERERNRCRSNIKMWKEFQIECP